MSMINISLKASKELQLFKWLIVFLVFLKSFLSFLNYLQYRNLFYKLKFTNKCKIKKKQKKQKQNKIK